MQIASVNVKCNNLNEMDELVQQLEAQCICTVEYTKHIETLTVTVAAYFANSLPLQLIELLSGEA